MMRSVTSLASVLCTLRHGMPSAIRCISSRSVLPPPVQPLISAPRHHIAAMKQPKLASFFKPPTAATLATAKDADVLREVCVPTCTIHPEHATPHRWMVRTTSRSPSASARTPRCVNTDKDNRVWQHVLCTQAAPAATDAALEDDDVVEQAAVGSSKRRRVVLVDDDDDDDGDAPEATATKSASEEASPGSSDDHMCPACDVFHCRAPPQCHPPRRPLPPAAKPSLQQPSPQSRWRASGR